MSELKGYTEPRSRRPLHWHAMIALMLWAVLAPAHDASAASCVTPPTGLVGWWRAEGNANDSVSTNNGTLQGTATAGGAGQVGTAFTFDGTNGYVQIPDSTALRPTNLTVEAWVRFSALDSAGSGGSPAGDQFIVFKQNTRSSSFEGYNLGKTRIAGGDVFEFIISSVAGASVDLQGTNFIATNVWYHVAGVRGSNFVQLYVNGQLQVQAGIGFAQDYGNFPLYFGTSGQASWDHKLRGSLDEVSLYNRALASNEIAAIYNAGASGKCQVPVISGQPQSQTVLVGMSTNFSVTAFGSVPLGYQWQRSNTNLNNGGNISGVTSTSLALTNVQTNDTAAYRVIVTNLVGAATSSVATLTVIVPTPAQITNLQATILQTNSARLNGQVLATGGDAPTITIYYGPVDGGTNEAGWAQNGGLGVQSGSYFLTVGGLSPNNAYYFTAKAVNSAGTSWASVSRSFSTPAVNPPIQRVANTTLAMPSTPLTFGFSLTNAFGALNFLDPVCLATPPGETNRLFVVERGGTIAVITNLAVPNRTVFLDITNKVIANLEECGLLSLVFHPGYATNGWFFVWYYGPDSTSAGSGAHDILSRYKVSAGNPNSADAASEVKFIRQFDENQFHNAGDMHFGADGNLYLSLGDEGGANGQYNNDQRIDKDLFSGLIRIDVDKRAGSLAPNSHAATTTNYTIPPDNPFIGATNFNGVSINTTNVRTEFYAVGMRNPWRWTFDPPTGLLYLGDVGQNTQEEVDIIVRGGNYGWAYAEGCAPGPKSPPGGFTSVPPIFCYGRGSGTNQGFCVIGGPVYRGTLLSQLTGSYICGDNVSGHIWALIYNGTNVTSQQTLISGGAVGLSSFGIDPRNGDVLLAIRGVEGSSSTTQPLRRLVYSSSASGQPLPATLKDTGAFSDLATLSPNPGIVPYDINVPFWSDNAVKSRWFSIPNTNLTMTFSPTNPWGFPTGTVWIKHFDLQTNSSPPLSTRLETRLLVRNGNGVYGVTYRWGGSTNAALVTEGGQDEAFVINNGGTITTQVWHYPGRSECVACHTAVAGHALGVKAPQMNRDMTYPGGTANQLQVLSDVGYFDTPVTDIPQILALAAATNASASLEFRVRSYLEANCVQCHQPGGAGRGLWDARIAMPTPQCGLINGPLIDNLGNSSNVVIAPGSLSNSVLLTRVAQMGSLHMPPLATSLINTTAVQLLSDWITNGLIAGQLSVSPPSLDFGLVAIGATPQASFVLANQGAGPLTNGLASIANGPFTILSGTPFSLPGAGITNLVVRFAPTNSANFTNLVIFTTGNGINATNLVTGSAAAAPLAGFSGDPTSGLVPLSVYFTNASTGAISNALWAFGDGSTSNTMLPVVLHQYTTAATNTVSLTVSGQLGTNTLSRTNYILVTSAQIPVADFVASPLSGSWPLSVSFTDNSTGTITNAFWDFGDGASTNITALNIAHVYAVPGTNSVSLTVSGPVGINTMIRSGYIIVTNPAPVTITIQRSGNQLELTWPAGTLQSASDPIGPYTNVPSATSPYAISPAGETQFFRVQVR